MKKKISLILAMLLCVTMLFPFPVSASIADDAVSYEFGETYKGTGDRVFTFKLTQKSNVYIKYSFKTKYHSGFYLSNDSGKELIGWKDFIYTYNATTDRSTYTCTRVLPAGTYYFVGDLYIGSSDYSFFATAEKAISLSRPTIKTLKNSASKKMKVTVSSVKNRTGYQYQYATNSKFRNAKTVKGGTTKTISKLTKGKTYYVRVRAYTIYGAGNTVYSAWSPVKYVKIKK